MMRMRNKRTKNHDITEENNDVLFSRTDDDYLYLNSLQRSLLFTLAHEYGWVSRGTGEPMLWPDSQDQWNGG